MRPNQEVYKRVEKMEIIKLRNTCMKSRFIIVGCFSLIKCLGLRLKSSTPMCPNILIVYRSELYKVIVKRLKYELDVSLRNRV
jgi:hypothetical protein